MPVATVNPTPVTTVKEYEQQFRRAGLPAFIDDYSASRDVFTRAAPFLTLVFVGEMFGAIDLDWGVWANVGAAAGGLVILILAWAVANVLRGRPPYSLPNDVGKVELALFVLVPALLPLIFGGQWQSALVTIGVNIVLLLLSYGVIGYGLLSIVRWVAVRLVGELGASAVRLARAIPLILGGAVILFLTTELWQVFSDMELSSLIILASFFVGIGVLFLVARLPAEVRRLEGDGPALTRRQRVNVGLVLFVSQALQVLVVALGVGVFFVVLGALAVGPGVREQWIGTSGNLVVDVPVLGGITEELLRVAGGLAALSGLSYAVQMQTDDTYRRLFLDEVEREMRETFRLRAEYVRARYS
jgi:hypothetical protein